MAVDMGHGPVSMGTKFGAVSSGQKADAATVSTASLFQPTGVATISPVVWLLGVIVLWVAFKLIGDSPKTSIEGAHIHLGAYNVGTIMLTTVAGLALLKLVFNRWQVPGATDLINFV